MRFRANLEKTRIMVILFTGFIPESARLSWKCRTTSDKIPRRYKIRLENAAAAGSWHRAL